MLILPDTDAFRVNFNKLRERVHEAATDGNRAAHRNVFVRKFLARHFACRVNRRAAFVDDDDRNRRGNAATAHERFRFAGSRAVPDRDCLNFKLVAKQANAVFRIGVLRGRAGCRINHFVVEQFSLRIEHDEFAARAEPRVECQHAFLPERGRHEKFGNIGRENANRFFVGAFLRLQARLGFKRRAKQALPRIVRSRADFVPASTVPADKNFVQTRKRLVFIHRDAEKQKAFLFAPANRQNAVRRRRRERLAPLEVIFEFRALGFLAFDDLGRKLGGFFVDFPAGSTRRFVVGNAFGENVARARKRGGDVGNVFVGRDEFCGFGGGIGVLIFKNKIGERFESAFPRDRSARAALRFVGRVNIFELGGGFGFFDSGFEFRREVFVVFERFENCGAAGVELAELFEAVANRCDLHFIHFAGGFFAVARDKRHGCALCEELGDSHDARHGKVVFLRDAQNVIGNCKGVFGRCFSHKKIARYFIDFCVPARQLFFEKKASREKNSHGNAVTIIIKLSRD